jgi:predicted SAM-dependent methyltransferase
MTMLYALADLVNNLAFMLTSHRKITLSSDINKINLGCGNTVAPNWINVDGSPAILLNKFPKFLLRYILPYDRMEVLKGNKFIHFNLQNDLPFKNNSADYIYMSHVLEHLYKNDGEHLLQEIFRVLKPGGIVRIGVPDLDLELLKPPEEIVSSFLPQSREPYFSYHRYMYNFSMLRCLLETLNFQNISKKEFQVGEVPDIETLDNRPDETLYVEAQKSLISRNTSKM